jgi:hypothetical protein
MAALSEEIAASPLPAGRPGPSSCPRPCRLRHLRRHLPSCVLDGPRLYTVADGSITSDSQAWTYSGAALGIACDGVFVFDGPPVRDAISPICPFLPRLSDSSLEVLRRFCRVPVGFLDSLEAGLGIEAGGAGQPRRPQLSCLISVDMVPLLRWNFGRSHRIQQIDCAFPGPHGRWNRCRIAAHHHSG